MPAREADIERALREVAPSVDGHDAFERVAQKRARRKNARTARLGALAVVVALVAVSVVLLARDNDPAGVTTPVAPAGNATPLVLSTDEGYLRGPLTRSGALVSVAAYDRDGNGGYDFPPSRIVRFDPDTLKVVDRVDLKAEILSVIDGADGVRYAVTRNHDPDGPVAAGVFLKRIDRDGTVTSVPLPPGTDITGGLVVDAAYIVLPTSAGALWFDAEGQLVPRPPGLDDPAASSVLSGHGESSLRLDARTMLATSNGQLLKLHVER